MFEAYAIGVTLKLNNLVSPQLVLLSKEFMRLEGLTVALNAELRKVGTDVTGLRAIASAGNASNRALEKASRSAADFERQLAAIRLHGAALGSVPFLPGPGGGGRGGGSGGSGGGHGRGGYGRFHGGNLHLGSGGLGVGSIGMSAGDAFIPIAVTAAAVYAGKALFDSAKDLDTERQRFKLLGMSGAQNADAFKYIAGLNVYGTTQLERTAAFREAQGVGRESGLQGSAALDFAKLATPTLSKLDALGQGLDEESKAALHQSNVALLRFAEQAGGLKSPAEFNRLANIAYKLRQSSGGTIDFEQLRAVTAQGGAYTQRSSDVGFAYREPIIQEMKGSAYGTAVATAGSRLFNVLSRTPQNLVAEATRLGLWTKDRTHLSEADSALFKDSFERFYIERVMPLYQKFGITGSDKDRENAILFGRTGGRAANLVDKQVPSILRSVDAFRKASDIDKAGAELQKSLSGEQLQFEAAWTDFKANWGTTMLPFFTGILKGGASMLHAVSPSNSGSVPGADHPPTWLLWMGRTMAFLGNKGVQDALHTIGDDRPSSGSNGSRYVAGGKGGGVTVRVPVNIDGRQIAEVVTKHQTDAVSAPQTGIDLFDSRSMLTPPGAGGLY